MRRLRRTYQNGQNPRTLTAPNAGNKVNEQQELLFIEREHKNTLSLWATMVCTKIDDPTTMFLGFYRN